MKLTIGFDKIDLTGLLEALVALLDASGFVIEHSYEDKHDRSPMFVISGPVLPASQAYQLRKDVLALVRGSWDETNESDYWRDGATFWFGRGDNSPVLNLSESKKPRDSGMKIAQTVKDLRDKLVNQIWFVTEAELGPLLESGMGHLVVCVQRHSRPRTLVRLDNLRAIVERDGSDIRQVFTKPEWYDHATVHQTIPGYILAQASLENPRSCLHNEAPGIN